MNRNRVNTLSALAACALAVSLPSGAFAQGVTDHGTFDSTNPANVESGVFCRGATPIQVLPRPWLLHVAMSNIGSTVQTFKIINKPDNLSDPPDFVQYRVPAESSLSLTYAGGNNNSSRQFRVDADGATTLSGYVSAESLATNTSVFCKSCDNDDGGPAYCDARIPN